MISATLLPLLLIALTATPADRWPAFRGAGDSLAAATQLPLEWSDDQGVAWQLPLTGYGQSSPVVWGDRVFVTAVDGESKEELLVMCASVPHGTLEWTQRFKATQTTKLSDYVSRGAPTPAVDADRVYAFFESGDLIALDHRGSQQWTRHLAREFGELRGNHGIGASLACSRDAIFVLVEHEGPSYLLALDKVSGKTRWKIDRPAKVSWTSPIVNESGSGSAEVIVGSAGTLEAFRVDDGKRLWWLSGLEGNTVPSPTVGAEHVVVGSTHVASNIAVRRGHTGELSAEQIAWRSKDASSSFASPLVYQDRVYFINRAGAAFCLDLATGRTLWTQRLAGSCWASPVGAEGRVYFFGKDGVTTVVKAAATFEKLAINKLTIEGRVYGVAPVHGAFLLRTGKKLICVGNP
ncbi:MAG TPA: PQQ-binding-like beta-propeller repeat protein [Pirellulales bacterium]